MLASHVDIFIVTESWQCLVGRCVHDFPNVRPATGEGGWEMPCVYMYAVIKIQTSVTQVGFFFRQRESPHHRTLPVVMSALHISILLSLLPTIFVQRSLPRISIMHEVSGLLTNRTMAIFVNSSERFSRASASRMITYSTGTKA